MSLQCSDCGAKHNSNGVPWRNEKDLTIHRAMKHGTKPVLAIPVHHTPHQGDTMKLLNSEQVGKIVGINPKEIGRLIRRRRIRFAERRLGRGGGYMIAIGEAERVKTMYANARKRGVTRVHLPKIGRARLQAARPAVHNGPVVVRHRTTLDTLSGAVVKAAYMGMPKVEAAVLTTDEGTMFLLQDGRVFEAQQVK